MESIPPLTPIPIEPPPTRTGKKRPASTANAVYLPRALMAERVGMTPMAFAKFVQRTKLPEGVAVRHGRSWFYSVERFLAFFAKGGR